jgi:phosphoglycolate phosphatase
VPPSPPPAIVFDLDNTVVHSRIDFAGIRHDLGALLLDAGVVEEPIVTHGPKRRSIGQLIELAEAQDQLVGGQLAERMWKIVVEYELEGMRVATVEPDAGPTLAALRARGHALGILTNNARASALEALEKFDLLGHLDLVLGREDVPAMKPSPSGLVVARDRLDGAASGLWMVGDSYLDGLAATGAECPFVAFRPRPGDLEERRIAPVAVIAQLRELVEILRRP